MLRLLGHLIVTALALWAAALVLPGMHLGEDAAGLGAQVLTVLGVAVVFALVDALVRPLAKALTMPITCVTLGLFLLVLNALMLLLTGWIAGRLGLTLTFDSFWWALGGGIVVGLLTSIVEAMFEDGDRDRERA